MPQPLRKDDLQIARMRHAYTLNDLEMRWLDGLSADQYKANQEWASNSPYRHGTSLFNFRMGNYLEYVGVRQVAGALGLADWHAHQIERHQSDDGIDLYQRLSKGTIKWQFKARTTQSLNNGSLVPDLCLKFEEQNTEAAASERERQGKEVATHYVLGFVLLESDDKTPTGEVIVSGCIPFEECTVDTFEVRSLGYSRRPGPDGRRQPLPPSMLVPEGALMPLRDALPR